MKGLFVTYNRIGDAVLSTGILGELIRKYPELRLTVACGPIAAPIFKVVPNLSEIISMPKRKASLHWFDLWQKCFSTHWDLLVDLRNSPVSRLLRARKKYIGGTADPSRHRVEHLAAVMDMSIAPSPRLWLNHCHHQMAQKLLPKKRPILALGPVANWKGKQWDGAKFAELANRLTSGSGVLQGAPVVVLGGPEERDQTGLITQVIPPDQRIDLVGKVDLLTGYPPDTKRKEPRRARLGHLWATYSDRIQQDEWLPYRKELRRYLSRGGDAVDTKVRGNYIAKLNVHWASSAIPPPGSSAESTVELVNILNKRATPRRNKSLPRKVAPRLR